MWINTKKAAKHEKKENIIMTQTVKIFVHTFYGLMPLKTYVVCN